MELGTRKVIRVFFYLGDLLNLTPQQTRDAIHRAGEYLELTIDHNVTIEDVKKILCFLIDEQTGAT